MNSILKHILRLLTAVPLLLAVSCIVEEEENVHEEAFADTKIRFGGIGVRVKAMDPDETKISDINIFIFNSHGMLEYRDYISGDMIGRDGRGNFHTVELLRNAAYSIYVCANFGYQIEISSLSQLKACRYHIAYPDDYSIGMPMSGYVENIVIDREEIAVPLVRLMARICISVDRSRLDKDVEYNIRNVMVGRCPKSITPFAGNHISDPFGFFPSGFNRNDYETDILNTSMNDGKSGEISLYMLENMQGELLPGNTDEKFKVFADNDFRGEFCSYIEIRSEYVSSSHYSLPGEYLIYRLYPGESPSNFDICRNCEYRITVIPTGSGLDGAQWRIDKSGLAEYGDCYMRITPGNFIRCKVGDTVTVSCDFSPPKTPFDIGIEELEYDKARGIYDYAVSDDGKSVTLFAKSRGSGLLYMETGEPINQAELIMIVVD